MHCLEIDRGKGRKLYLYSKSKKDYSYVPALESVEQKGGYVRWHDFREEWVFYSPTRQNRTFLPKKIDCPLCPGINGKRVTEISVTNYDIAVFDNRFSSLSINKKNFDIDQNDKFDHSYGYCEVICYSPEHKANFGKLSVSDLELLVKVWGDRYVKLMQDKNIHYVLPFENKGSEIGVTLNHPHGQIYAFSHIPEIILKQAKNHNTKTNLLNLIESLDETLIIQKDSNSILFVPPFARYPFELWLVPFKKVDHPGQLSNEETNSMVNFLKLSVNMLDAIFKKNMPYTMSVNCAPRNFENSFHHFISFQPIRRDNNKLKFLAGIEQITGLMLCDIKPEDSAMILKSVKVD